jgi:hypothetical protein
LKGEGEDKIKEGLSPLLDTPKIGEQRGAKPLKYYREFKRDEVPLQKKPSPFPLPRGKGDKGG